MLEMNEFEKIAQEIIEIKEEKIKRKSFRSIYIEIRKYQRCKKHQKENKRKY